jgi:Caspase domain
MRRFLPWLPACAATLVASCSLTLFDYSNIVSKRYALVYGVTMYTTASGYPAGTYPNLSFPDSDARAVAAMLKSEGYVTVLRYTDASGEEWLVDPTGTYDEGSLAGDMYGANGPSKANMVADIQNYFQGVVGQNDVFVLYFSGHGMQSTGSSPPIEYIVPEGGVQLYGGQYEGDASLSLSDSELGAMIAAVPTKRRVVILDTCNSGGFIGNSLEADSIPPASNGSSGGISVQTLAQALTNYLSFPFVTSGISPYGGAMVLSAAGRDESCYEASSPFDHGVMTYFFLQAPQSGDLNHDGHVTVAEAFSLAKAGIDNDWNPGNPAYSFEPRISGGPVDFVLW